MEPPSWWSRGRLLEQYEEQERAKKQKAVSPSQAARNIDRALAGVKVRPTATAPEEEIQELMGDVSKLSPLEKKLRRYTVIKHGEQWRDSDPGRVKTDAENDPLYEKEVGVARHHISTWRRALGRKK